MWSQEVVWAFWGLQSVGSMHVITLSRRYRTDLVNLESFPLFRAKEREIEQLESEAEWAENFHHALVEMKFFSKHQIGWRLRVIFFRFWSELVTSVEKTLR